MESRAWLRRSAFVAAAYFSSGCAIVAGIDDVTLAGDGGTDSPDGVVDQGPDDTAVSDAPRPPTDGGGPSTGHCAALNGSSEMVQIDVLDPKWSYCIDKTEVTVAQLNAFLIADGDPWDAPAACDFDKSPRLGQDPDPSHQALAAGNVHWCYAWAYCRWVGKRLCGTIGGGDISYNMELSEWRYACANGKLNYEFTYGPTFDGTKCNFGSQTAAAPASYPECHGTVAPFDALYDMNGNVGEFDGYTDGESTIRALGGSFNEPADPSKPPDSNCQEQGGFDYHGSFAPVGFRCCGDP